MFIVQNEPTIVYSKYQYVYWYYDTNKEFRHHTARIHHQRAPPCIYPYIDSTACTSAKSECQVHLQTAHCRHSCLESARYTQGVIYTSWVHLQTAHITHTSLQREFQVHLQSLYLSLRTLNLTSFSYYNLILPVGASRISSDVLRISSDKPTVKRSSAGSVLYYSFGINSLKYVNVVELKKMKYFVLFL